MPLVTAVRGLECQVFPEDSGRVYKRVVIGRAREDSVGGEVSGTGAGRRWQYRLCGRVPIRAQNFAPGWNVPGELHLDDLRCPVQARPFAH